MKSKKEDKGFNWYSLTTGCAFIFIGLLDLPHLDLWSYIYLGLGVLLIGYGLLGK